jgi:hypothetical protein
MPYASSMRSGDDDVAITGRTRIPAVNWQQSMASTALIAITNLIMEHNFPRAKFEEANRRQKRQFDGSQSQRAPGFGTSAARVLSLRDEWHRPSCIPLHVAEQGPEVWTFKL